MHCAFVRKNLIERELGLLGHDVQRSVERHLADCGACAAVARREARLTEDLVALRTEAPFEIDVTARVASSIERLAPDRAAVPVRSLGWASAAAAACAAGLTVAFWGMLPELGSGALQLWDLTSALGGVALKLGSALLSVLSVPLEFVRGLLSSLAGIVERRAAWEPAAVALLALGYVSMAVLITLFVGRDLRKPRAVRG